MASSSTGIVAPPPIRTPLLNSDNTLASSWAQWFTALIKIINAVDFESGTWIPNISDGIITGMVTATGTWSKLGDQIFFQVFIDATAGTFNGFHISNLPFPASGHGTCTVVTSANVSLGSGSIQGSIVTLPPMNLSPAGPNNSAIVSGSYTLQA